MRRVGILVGIVSLTVGLTVPAGASEELPGATPAAPAAGTSPVAPVAAVATPRDVPAPRSTLNGRRPVPGHLFEVVAAESALHRDAVAATSPVGKVVRGDRVTYLDSIDRRLRILNALIFDGGHWIKVQAPDGTVG